jgi:hypothetical protein
VLHSGATHCLYKEALKNFDSQVGRIAGSVRSWIANLEIGATSPQMNKPHESWFIGFRV